MPITLETAAGICFAAAAVASLAITPLVRTAARWSGLTDKPDALRKLHREPTPLGGGVAVFLAAGLVGLVFMLLPNRWMTENRDWTNVWALLVSCTAILLLGLVDDRLTLRGRHKLLGQVLIVGFLMSFGFVIRRLGLFGHEVDLGLLAWPFTMFWLLGAINAMNLLDGMDGLATTLGVIVTATIGVLALAKGDASVALVAFLFAGSLLGFLRYNFPPASIFLGDAGSMLIGLIVGVISIRASLKGPGTVLLAAPLAALTIPIVDSTAAILRRKLTGRSMYATDRSHLHHRFLERLGTNRRVLACVAAACLLTSAGALVSTFVKNDFVAVGSCLGVVAILLVTGLFGRGEARLVARRLRNFGRSLLHPVAGGQGVSDTWSVRLDGSCRWEPLWEALTATTERFHLMEIKFDVSVPAAKEDYHASWKRPERLERERLWSVEMPLQWQDRAVGRVCVAGRQNDHGRPRCIEELLTLIATFQLRLDQLADQQSAAPDGDFEPQRLTFRSFKSSQPQWADSGEEDEDESGVRELTKSS